MTKLSFLLRTHLSSSSSFMYKLSEKWSWPTVKSWKENSYQAKVMGGFYCLFPLPWCLTKWTLQILCYTSTIHAVGFTQSFENFGCFSTKWKEKIHYKIVHWASTFNTLRKHKRKIWMVALNPLKSPRKFSMVPHLDFLIERLYGKITISNYYEIFYLTLI